MIDINGNSRKGAETGLSFLVYKVRTTAQNTKMKYKHTYSGTGVTHTTGYYNSHTDSEAQRLSQLPTFPVKTNKKDICPLFKTSSTHLHLPFYQIINFFKNVSSNVFVFKRGTQTLD